MAVILAAILLLALGITLPVFALKFRTQPADPDVAGRPASVLFGLWIRQWLVWVLGPLERLLLRTGVSPDALNLSGLLGGIGAGIGFAAGRAGLAAWLLAAGGLCDILDGRVARARGLASRYGAFIDSVLDRFSETGTLLGVGWYLRGSAWQLVAVMVALSGSLLVSYARARGEALGVNFAGGLMQRAERVVVLALGALAESAFAGRAGPPPGTVLGAAVTLIAVGTMVTAVHRTVVVARRLLVEGPDR
jgi:phosphatidylglycerophosphate synthase